MIMGDKQNKRQTQQINNDYRQQTEQKTDSTDEQWPLMTNRQNKRQTQQMSNDHLWHRQNRRQTNRWAGITCNRQRAKDRPDPSTVVTCDGENILRQIWQTNKEDRQINGQTWWINNGCLRCLPIQVNDAENGVWHIASGNPLVHSVDVEVKRPVRFPQHSDSVPYLLRMRWRNNAVTVTVHVRKEALFGCLKQCWNGYNSSKKGSIVLLSQTMQERLQF